MSLKIEITKEDVGIIEGICRKGLRVEAVKRGIPLDKVFQRPHPQTVIEIGRKCVRELELIIPLILDSVELEELEKECL